MDEYQVKAAFLYNFTKFVEWPPDAFKTSKDPIQVCVLGRNPFGSSLDDLTRGKSVEGRAFALRQVSDAHEASTCQILFVSAAAVSHFRSILGRLKPDGILTVGEAEGFASEGGIINFTLDGGHLRFEINLDAAEHAQLRISSKLLGLAQIIRTERPR
jgi:hypothetical protein